MKITAAVIDTNVVVAGLLTRQAESPTARILDGMRVAAAPASLPSTEGSCCVPGFTSFTG